MQAQRPLENMIAEAVFSFQDTILKMDNCQLSTVNCQLFTVGIDWPEGPPVPIPNTEVKLRIVDDSMRVTACENR